MCAGEKNCSEGLRDWGTLSALCHRGEGASGPKPCPAALVAWWERNKQPETSENTWARHWSQSISGTCPSSAPPWVDAGEEVLRWSGREERTYHLIVDRGGWWVVVREQSCRDWPPVSQVIILEEKGDCRGERIRLGCGLPHQLKFKVKGVCILSRSRVQTEMRCNPIHNNLSESSRLGDRPSLSS